jgi:Pectate lyase superfamily protein
MTSTVFSSGTVITAPWLNDVNTAVYTTVPSNTSAIATLNGATGAANVGYTPAGTGATATTVQTKLRQTVSVKDFGAVGDGTTDNYNAMLAAWNYAYPIGANLYFPAGTYLVSGERSYPFNQGYGTITSLLECNNMTIYGDGPSSILKTSSVNGADVLQLNGLKNFHARNLQILSVVSGSTSGSNGISITGGFDNLTFDNIWMKNLAYVDRTTYIDGGKAFTIQPPSEANPILMGSIKATNLFADGCVYGAGYEPDNDLALIQPVSIDIDIVVSNSRQGMVFSSGSATSTLAANSVSGVRVKLQSINNMQDVVVSRCFGIDVNCQIVQTKTQAQLLLSYKGTQWTSVDSIANVIGAIIQYAKNSRIAVYGNKKSCRYKASIGGALEGSSGLNGATDQCDIYLDITGTSDSVDVQYNDAGGNIMNNSRLYCTTSTTTTLPIQFYDPALNNTLTIGPETRLKNVSVTSSIQWTETDGRTVYHNMFIQSDVLSTKQTLGSSADLKIQQWLNNAGTPVAAFRNDGALSSAYAATATAVATIKRVFPLYDMAGALVGYIPIYTSYS